MNDNMNQPNFFQANVYGPITPSQMFERTAALLRENFKLFFGIALVVIGVEIIVAGILGGGGIWMDRYTSGVGPIARALFLFPLALLGAALIFILTQIIQGALFIATQARLTNAPMTVGDACKFAADKAGRLIGIALLVALRTIGYFLLLCIAGTVIAVIAALLFGGLGHAAGTIPFRIGHAPYLGVGIFALLFLLFFLVIYLIMLLWLVARYALSIPAALAENLSVTESIRRSIHLSGGSRGRLYALFLGIFGFYIVIAAVTVPVQLMATRSFHAHPATTSAFAGFVLLLLAIFRILIGALVLVWIGVASALCYFDLRVRKEGFGAPSVTAPPEIAPAIAPPPPDFPMEDFPVS